MSFDASSFGDGGGDGSLLDGGASFSDPSLLSTDGSTADPFAFLDPFSAGAGSGAFDTTSPGGQIDMAPILPSDTADPAGASVVPPDSTNSGLGSEILGGIGSVLSGIGGTLSNVVDGLTAAAGGVGQGLGSLLTAAAPSLARALPAFLGSRAGSGNLRNSLASRTMIPPGYSGAVNRFRTPGLRPVLPARSPLSSVSPSFFSLSDMGLPTTPADQAPSLGDLGGIGLGTGDSMMSMAPFDSGIFNAPAALPGGATSDGGWSSFFNNALSFLTGGGQPSSSNPTQIGIGNTMSMPAVPGGGMVVGRARGPIPVTYTTPSGRTSTVYYVSRGRPLLFSGDLAACKRVLKIARHARRAYGMRHHSSSRRRYR